MIKPRNTQNARKPQICLVRALVGLVASVGAEILLVFLQIGSGVLQAGLKVCSPVLGRSLPDCLLMAGFLAFIFDRIKPTVPGFFPPNLTGCST